MKPKALITGANGTLGKEFVKQLKEKGYHTIGITRKEFDLTEKGIGEKILKKVGSVDLLVNNAGKVNHGKYAEVSMEKDLEIIKVNAIATAELCKVYAKQMRKDGGGKILNVASEIAMRNGKGMAVYTASKAFIVSLSRSLNRELKEYGISVTVTCPHAFRSPMVQGKERVLTSRIVAKQAIEGMLEGKEIVYNLIPFSPMDLLSRIKRKAIRELRAKIMGKW